MQIHWPKGLEHKYSVCHPTNTDGTTWLRESDLVFDEEKHPYAVFKWHHEAAGDVPEVYVELKPALLAHDGQDPHYRYDGELPDPTRPRRPL